MPSWSQWIAAHRKHMGLSKKGLADSIGMNERTVVNWEKGRGSPGKYAQGKIAELFGEKL